MKKLIALLAVNLPLAGQAQPPEGQDWWACQSVKAGGLSWENQQWNSATFAHSKRFILIADGDGLTPESIVKATGAIGSEFAECVDEGVGIYCITALGTSFGFNPATETGVITEIAGGVVGPMFDTRDTVSVMPFECAKG